MSPDRQLFAFNHLLTQEAAYAALLLGNRRALHSAAADALLPALRLGSPEELPLLSILRLHLRCAARFAEAHRMTCRLLMRRCNLGQLAGWQDLADDAAELWQQARREDPQLAEVSADFANAMALCTATIGNVVEAAEWAQRALQAARAAGDIAAELLALNGIGYVCHAEGSTAEALTYYASALDLARHHGQENAELQLLNNLGLVHYERQDVEQAGALLREGLERARSMDSPLHIANLALNLALVEAAQGRVELALACYDESLAAANRIGDIQTIGIVNGNIGELCQSSGELERAERLTAIAISSAVESGVLRLIAHWTGRMARIRLDQGRPVEAWDLAQAALKDARRCGDRIVLATQLEVALMAALAVQETAAARALLSEARTFGQSIDDPRAADYVEGLALLEAQLQVLEGKQ